MQKNSQNSIWQLGESTMCTPYRPVKAPSTPQMIGAELNLNSPTFWHCNSPMASNDGHIYKTPWHQMMDMYAMPVRYIEYKKHDHESRLGFTASKPASHASCRAHTCANTTAKPSSAVAVQVNDSCSPCLLGGYHDCQHTLLSSTGNR